MGLFVVLSTTYVENKMHHDPIEIIMRVLNFLIEGYGNHWASEFCDSRHSKTNLATCVIALTAGGCEFLNATCIALKNGILLEGWFDVGAGPQPILACPPRHNCPLLRSENFVFCQCKNV
jgi:hypothetical protein